MRLGLFLIAIGLLFSCSENKQNFVFILVDDLGWTDLGYSGSEFYETPNIDAWSSESIIFDNAYSSGSVCSPSRASILTGKNPARVNITDWIPGRDPKDQKLIGPQDYSELQLDENTLAEVLGKNGYETFFAGKWHLGDEGYFPEDQGYKYNFGGHHRGSPPGGYYTPYKNPKLSDGPEGEYLTDRLTNESIKFLENIGEEPFFLTLSFYTVHTPIQANQDYIDKFQSKLNNLGNPENKSRKEGNGTTRLSQYNPEYASMIYSMDKNVGRLIEKLKALDLYESTTIIFTSDNGGLSTLDSNYKNLAPTSVLPLRGGKGWLYEGGIRVPLVIKPSYYKANKIMVSEPVIGHDFYPTILSLAGINEDISEIDGYDLNPLINGKESLERNEIFWHYPHYHGSAWKPGAAIRQGKWKLIEFYEDEYFELYDLSVDISESKNISKEMPEKAQELLERLHYLQEDSNAKFSFPNPEFKD